MMADAIAADQRSFGSRLVEFGLAKIVARFLRRFDPQRERCWIAERDGTRVGVVFLVKTSGSARLP